MHGALITATNYPTYSPHCNCSCPVYLPHENRKSTPSNNLRCFIDNVLLSPFSSSFLLANFQCALFIRHLLIRFFSFFLITMYRSRAPVIYITLRVSIFENHDFLHLSANLFIVAAFIIYARM